MNKSEKYKKDEWVHGKDVANESKDIAIVDRTGFVNAQHEVNNLPGC